MDAEMPLVAAKKFVRALPDEGDLHILPRPLADEIHRNNGGRGDRFLKRFDDFGSDRSNSARSSWTGNVSRAEKRGGFRRVLEFVVCESFAVSDRVGRPVPPLSFISARSDPESRPPLRRIPTGTSLRRCRLYRGAIELEKFLGRFVVLFSG